MTTLNYPRFRLIYFVGPNSDRRTADFGTKFRKLLYVLCFPEIVDVCPKYFEGGDIRTRTLWLDYPTCEIQTISNFDIS